MKNKKGITLIALIITIIVLLILAGVSISILTGDNGVISNAQNSKTQTSLASAKEFLEMAWSGCETEYFVEGRKNEKKGYFTVDKLNNYLSKGEIKEISHEVDLDGSSEIAYQLENGNYYKAIVSSRGEVTIDGGELSTKPSLREERNENIMLQFSELNVWDGVFVATDARGEDAEFSWESKIRAIVGEPNLNNFAPSISGEHNGRCWFRATYDSRGEWFGSESEYYELEITAIVYSSFGGWNSGKLILKAKDYACFVAGTKISTVDGLKNIENICAGDLVYSWNEEKSEVEISQVVENFRRESSIITKIILSNGEIIDTTPVHPFYVKDKGYIKAGELVEGDILQTKSGEEIEISSINSKVGESVVVYNFTVESNHNYYVGETEILVHNAPECT